MYKIEMIEGMGRGIVSIKHIWKGTIIEICELLVLSEIDTKLVNLTELEFYTFKYNQNQDCLVLGNGEIYNHSDKPNVKYQIGSKNDRSVMFFIALKDIEPNEQLCINYQDDTMDQIDTKKYVENKSLID